MGTVFRMLGAAARWFICDGTEALVFGPYAFCMYSDLEERDDKEDSW
jgi:hypothetical protein